MLWLIHLLVVLLGLVIGSFLNVCIHRIPIGVSVVRPRSRCPQCGHQIGVWENIPILSYILLGGRCRQCRGRISPVYPIVEALTAVGFYLLFLKYGFTGAFWLNCIFFSLLISLSVIDLFHRILPDVLTLSGMLVGLALAPLQSAEFFGASAVETSSLAGRYASSLLGIVLGGGILWITAQLYLWWRKIEGMGFGDIKMMAMAGAFLGWRYAWLTVFLGSLLGAVIGLLYISVSRRDRRYELPFGTFLGFAALGATLWGPRLLAWYLG